MRFENVTAYFLVGQFTFRGPLFVPFQLPLSPMRVFAIRIKYALDVTIQRRHDPNPREHRRPSRRRQGSSFQWQSTIKKTKAQRSVIQPQPNNWDCELIEF
jgi:hypothetical protein